MLLACALTTLTLAAPSPRTVYAGAYLTDVSDFDLKAGRFKADVRVWAKWRGTAEPIPELSFENGELDDKVELGREDDAEWHSVMWRVQGTFRGDFPVHAFPFDRQTLPVVLGLDEAHGLLVPDLAASGMASAFSITGWAYEPYFTARGEERLYRSDLGSVHQEGKAARQRVAIFSVEMRRPFGPYLIKFVLPLFLILVVALLALLLPADRLDVRSAMGITALLACFAFHYTQAGTLPEVTYLVAADKLFLGSYLFVAGTLVFSIAAYRLHERRSALARRLDRTGIWAFPVTTGVSLVFLVTSAQPQAQSVTVDQLPPQQVALTSEPVLRIAVPSLDTVPVGNGLPSARSPLVVRSADGTFVPVVAERAPAMTNELVRLLPEGGMRVRWAVREGTRWSDGTEVTAADLEASALLQNQPLRTAVTRVDQRSIDVTYSARRSEWLAGFPLFPASQLRPDAGRETLSRAMAEGTLPTAGAYLFERSEPQRSLTLKRNEAFIGDPPVFERLELVAKAPMDAVAALLAREVDVVSQLTPDAYERVMKEPSVRVLEQPGELTWVLVPKLDAAPWDSLERRQALLTVLRREQMVAALAPMPTRIASGWRPEPTLPPPPARPLALDGGVTLNVLPLGTGDAPHAVLAKRVVADLEQVGVQVTLVERADLRQAVTRGEFEGLALLSRDTDDPGRFMNVPSENGRLRLEVAAGPHYDDEMAERYAFYVSTLYTERKDFLSAAMQEAWWKRLPMIPLVLTSRLTAVRADLKGPEWGKADSVWWNVASWHLQ